MPEVIVQYVGLGNEIFDGKTQSYQELLGGFAIVKATSLQIKQLATDSRVLYLEYPRDVFFENCPHSGETKAGLKLCQVSDLNRICRGPDSSLTGEGVLMAYLDSGIDYRHPEFLNEEGKTRILEIFDLSTEPGTVYTEEQINEALLLPRQEGNNIVPETDGSGHGTHVAGIGSGNSGVAPGTDILMVKLGRGVRQYSRTSELMLGMDHCVRLAVQRNQPVVLNISYGNNYGAHNGTSMVEQYLDGVLNYAKAVIVVGSGNEGGGKGHFSGEVSAEKPVIADFSVGEFQKGFGFSLFKDFPPDMGLELRQPGGAWQRIDLNVRQAVYPLREGQVRVYNETPSPRAVFQEVYMELQPEESIAGDNPQAGYLLQGLWQIRVTTTRVQPWQVDIWLPVSESLSPLTGFLQPSPETTLTIPSSARRAITVGAYDTRFGQVAAFSGRGNTWNDHLVKPDLVAPGVEIVSAAPGGGYTQRSGTSMATPFVSGAAALLMEWGIIRGRDPFLYADKVKAYLTKGAEPLTEFSFYPNERAGWGVLCIEGSLKEIPQNY